MASAAYEEEWEWTVEGPKTVARIAAWAAKQSEDWSALDAWAAARTGLSATTYGRRALLDLMRRGVIEETGSTNAAGHRMFRAEASAED